MKIKKPQRAILQGPNDKTISHNPSKGEKKAAVGDKLSMYLAFAQCTDKGNSPMTMVSITM